MSDAVCYSKKHLPFYIVAIVLVAFIFFMLFWQSSQQMTYQFYYDMGRNFGVQPFSNLGSETPNVTTIGGHNSAHSSAIHASPYVAPVNVTPVSATPINTNPINYNTVPINQNIQSTPVNFPSPYLNTDTVSQRAIQKVIRNQVPYNGTFSY
jgi:hypothetical protein